MTKPRTIKEWSASPNGKSWVYEAEDVCACVWYEVHGDHTSVWWDVSGPEGKGTKVSSCVPAATGLSLEDRVGFAKRMAELWVNGYRSGRYETDRAIRS